MSYLDIIPGASALPKPRLRRRAKDIGARNLRAILVHFVQANDQLTDEDESVLHQLLAYGYPLDPDDSLTQELQSFIKQDFTPKSTNVRVFYKVPRLGTISPWSSQATAIAQNRGLTKVLRVEHGTAFLVEFDNAPTDAEIANAREILHDRMTEQIIDSLDDASFDDRDPTPLSVVNLTGDAASDAPEALQKANKELGLALDSSEMDYLVKAYRDRLKRDPTDVELYMFAQVNSEHCRHKQFNAAWTVDGLHKDKTLFQWIRSTYQKSPQRVVSAYSDNAAVFEGASSVYYAPQLLTSIWEQTKETVHYIGKVETHNHPTAVSPYPGAATGSGGEIRDEGAVGRGSKPKAGLSGYFVSDLRIPGDIQPWELDVGKPSHIASSLDIMIDAPLGSSDYNNEFGRPALITDFYTFSMNAPSTSKSGKSEVRGYHKPVMVAGGVGTVRPRQALKEQGLVKPGDYLVVLGGPAMLIGLGGGAASSVQSAEANKQLDFASVQRGNAEVQRRAQEVINTCAYDTVNPISSIHDVGAGGLSNALTELVHDSGLGADFELRDIDSADKGMSPLEIWCCEAQERYVLAIAQDKLKRFKDICQRERCAYSVVGTATGPNDEGETKLVLTDREPPAGDASPQVAAKPIDLEMSVLFGKPPQMSRIVTSSRPNLVKFDASLDRYIPENPGPLFEAVSRVLRLPSVGSRSFLITIGDRSVGGLTVRDQMVGPWQTPVADVAVTATALERGIRTGEAMATGFRPSLALISPAASVRMALAECLMKLAAADLAERLNRVHLSANWMAASNHGGEGAALYEGVQAVSEFCQRLGVCVPVGKDSMSMKMTWKDAQSQEDKAVVAPLTLYTTAFGLVREISRTFTPALRRPEDVGETLLILVDLSISEDQGGKYGSKAMGGSALAQTFSQLGDEAPDIRDEGLFKDFFDAMEQLHEAGIVLAYHPRGTGGLMRTLCEMMFAGRCGAEVGLDELVRNTSTSEAVAALFNEELGAVFQIRKRDEIAFHRCFATCGPPDGLLKRLGRVPRRTRQKLTVMQGSQVLYSRSRADLQQDWASCSHAVARLRDDAACADAEFDGLRADDDPGLSYQLTFDPAAGIAARSWAAALRSPFEQKPRVAILREQGVNGHAEMAFAFQEAGFLPVDVHMTDLEAGRHTLAGFKGLAACGGFSYGDVLGAGRGWATGVLMNPPLRAEFAAFFGRADTFALGVCNGCQFLTHVKELVPGAERWPAFESNASERYEARVCMVAVAAPPAGVAPSVFLHGMAGSALPVATAHGEGRAAFAAGTAPQSVVDAGLAPLRYTDNALRPTEAYPANPNGSPLGIAAVRSDDGRVLAMMPHPERSVIAECCSWAPAEQARDWGAFGPWIRIFKSARRWVG